MMEWLDAHAGSVQALATFALIALTAYYAWFTRALVRETHATLQANARLTLQARLDRVSELFVREPDLFSSLDQPASSNLDEEQDRRFHVANMLMAVLEEAYTQHEVDGAMSEDDWGAWQVTLDSMMGRRYMSAYWQYVRQHYGASFRDFVDRRLQSA
jgi:hypothetical protein